MLEISSYVDLTLLAADVINNPLIIKAYVCY